MNPSSVTGTEKKANESNQPPPLADYNLYLSDPGLVSAVHREGGAWHDAELRELGRILSTEELQRWGFEANENEPVLHTHDRFGERRDEVLFHPSWHSLMQTSVERGLHNLPWAKPRAGAHVARAALLLLTAQNELGHTCPISMTFSSVAALRADPELAAEWEPRILSPNYDPSFRPAREKLGVLIGMGMTEKQGGSDIRANTTRAERLDGPREYAITGHKWFCSAPMCDAFLVLAQAPHGLSCFLLPRWTPAGERNRFHIQRLKRKMGNRSNASSEVEFSGAWAQLAGEEGRGIQTIIDMVQHTRLDCAIAAAGLMRQALVQALYHAGHRKAFGKLLIDQPLMRSVLADIAIESQAATLLAMRLARSFDLRANSETERGFSRVATAIAKFWLTKRAPVQVGEALECLGGNGYVEESILPRLYREAPLYSIWEGSGNVICLDVLRAMAKEPDALEGVLHEIRLGIGTDARFDRYAQETEAELGALSGEEGRKSSAESESKARIIAERAAIALQASLMLRHAPSAASSAFCASRLAGAGHTFGTLPSSVDLASILDEATKNLPA